MWVFGYGSLIWKVDFPFENKLVGCIKGYQRRFYQYSTDHRGTPDKPGRVVTLVRNKSEDEVWGVAYKIKDEDVEKVVGHLDYREKGGYRKQKILFYPKDLEIAPFELFIYVGTEDNVNFAGEADDDTIAEQIFNSQGPSGTNIEYILNLAKAMREIAPNISDEHLFTVEEKVLSLLNKN